MRGDLLAALSCFYFGSPPSRCQVTLLKSVSYFNSGTPFAPAGALSSATQEGKDRDFLEALENK